MTHRQSCWLKVFAAWPLGLTCALALGILTPAGAAPIAVQDAPQKAETEAQIAEPPPPSISAITDEELPNWQRFAAVPTARPASSAADSSGHNASVPEASKSADHLQQPLPVGPLSTQHPRTPILQDSGDTETGVGKSIHEAVKESIRPAYNQLVDSGVIETWHEVKASLGLDKSQWSSRDSAEGPAKAPNQWDASGGTSPYPVPPPRTAAQAQVDRELATMMREKLIDQVTPWLIGLVALYIMIHLIKLVVRYFRWKSTRRLARAQRQTMRRIHTSSRKPGNHTRPSPNSPAKSKETV